MHIKLPKITLICLLILFGFASSAHAVVYSFTDASGSTYVDPVSYAASDVDYYDYGTIPASSNTPDGLEIANTAVFFMYENSNTGAISLGMIFDIPYDAAGGSMEISLSGLPTTAGITVSDDASEGNAAVSSAGTWTDTWQWIGCCTDGAMMGGLDGEWTIEVVIGNYSGIDNFVFYDTASTYHTLDIANTNTFTITAASAPESSTLLLFGSSLIAFVGIKRRKRNDMGS